MGRASIVIGDDIRDDLEREASLEDASASAIAEKAIEAYLKVKKAKRMAVLDASSEADKGIFVSREAVDRWVASWGGDTELPMPDPDVFPAGG